MSDNAKKKMIRAYFQDGPTTMFLSNMFKSPAENFFNTPSIEFDIERSDEDVAVVVTDAKTGYHINAADLFVNKEFIPPVIKEAYRLRALEQQYRTTGEAVFGDMDFLKKASTQSFKLFRKVEGLIRRNMEWQASQVFQTGTVTLPDEDGNDAYTIDFKPKATHFPNASTAWNAASPNIAADLNSLASVIRTDGKSDPQTTIWGEGSFNIAVEDTDFKARFEPRRLDLGTISSFDMTDQGGIYRGIVTLGNYKMDVWTYGGQFKHPGTGTQTKFIADDKVVMLDNRARFDAVFGSNPRFVPIDPRVRRFVPGRMSSGRTGVDIQTNAWVTPEGEELFVGAASRPLMIPSAIDRYGCIDTGI
jgi:hypothetical protein